VAVESLPIEVMRGHTPFGLRTTFARLRQLKHGYDPHNLFPLQPQHLGR
jgi:hypothetical protein